MAYVVTASIAVSNATPKVGERVIATVTVSNAGGTIEVDIDGVEVQTTANSPLIVDHCSPDDLPQAGTNEAAGYGIKVIAAGASKTFKFGVVAPMPGTFYLNAVVIGKRADDSTRIQVATTSAASVTATAA